MSLTTIQVNLQDALDDVISSQTPLARKAQALSTLERLLALSCVPSDSTDHLSAFLSLQDTFECNIPSRLLGWISASTSVLELITNKGSMDHDREQDALFLSSQLAQSLTLIQGVSLIHKPSKRFLGRKYALLILLDLLLVSRHLPAFSASPPDEARASTSASDPTLRTSPPLLSIVLDTLLCILVDSSSALRSFEEAGGLQAVVKILKRPETLREVKMKCLEFLYFYLLDETPSWTRSHPTPFAKLADTSGTRTVPSTPQKLKPKAKIFPHSRGFPSRSSTSSSTSASGSSFSSVSSSGSSFTSDASHTPKSDAVEARSSPLTPQTPQRPSRLLMLRKEVDFIPQSPVKLQFRPEPVKEPDASRDGDEENEDDRPAGKGHVRARTTEEKKEILGGMLGNVDALVEGVRKAGVWGLG